MIYSCVARVYRVLVDRQVMLQAFPTPLSQSSINSPSSLFTNITIFSLLHTLFIIYLLSNKPRLILFTKFAAVQYGKRPPESPIQRDT